LDDLKNNKKPPEIYRQINLESCIFFLADFPHNLEDPRGYKLEITSFEANQPKPSRFSRSIVERRNSG